MWTNDGDELGNLSGTLPQNFHNHQRTLNVMDSDTSQTRTLKQTGARTSTEDKDVNVVSENFTENEATEFKLQKR